MPLSAFLIALLVDHAPVAGDELGTPPSLVVGELVPIGFGFSGATTAAVSEDQPPVLGGAVGATGAAGSGTGTGSG